MNNSIDTVVFLKFTMNNNFTDSNTFCCWYRRNNWGLCDIDCKNNTEYYYKYSEELNDLDHISFDCCWSRAEGGSVCDIDCFKY